MSAEPLRAAMVRFATLEPARWEAICRALAQLGFNAVDVPLVWREHERSAGEFDFATGRLALGAMLAAVRAAGLRAVVRLGPIVTDEAPGLCLPERVLRDRACQARTRRQNPVLVADPPRAVPLPSVASAAFREAACAWIAAAARALLEAEQAQGDDGSRVERVILGDGPHAALRDDPYEFDHHPDARGELAAIEPPHDGPHAAALAEVRRESAQAASYRLALREAALAAGLDPARVALAVPGSAAISPLAHQLAAAGHPLVLPCPPPIAGTLAIWRQVRHAVALTADAAHGPPRLHLDVWSGSPPYYPPARGSHTLEAARVALAAGARDFTVRMGCAGDRWVGAVLSEQGAPRPHAPQWRELLAWAARALPARGEELTAELLEPLAAVELARAATAVHPLPLGLLALMGIAPSHLASEGALLNAGGDSLGAHARRLDAAEHALVTAGLPVRRAAHAVAGAAAVLRGEGDDAAAAFVERAARELRAVTDAVTVDPAGAALVRAVRDAARLHLVLASRSAEPARVSVRAHGVVDAEGAPVVHGVELPLAPGEVLVLGAPAPARAQAREPSAAAHPPAAHAPSARRAARGGASGSPAPRKRQSTRKPR